MAFGMKRTRHQFAPAVPVQKIIDSAVAGSVSDGLFVGCFEIMDVQHLAGTSPFGKPGEQGLFLGQRHILVLAATIRLGLERFDAALVIGHVGPDAYMSGRSSASRASSARSFSRADGLSSGPPPFAATGKNAAPSQSAPDSANIRTMSSNPPRRR